MRRAMCQASSACSASPSMSVVTGTARTELTAPSCPDPDRRCQARCGRLAPMVVTLTREQVMAHRVAAQGLHRDRPEAVAALASLGIQDAGPTARLALAARTDGDPDPAAHGLVDGWTHRGAPHHPPPAERNAIALAARPFDDADAGARLHWSGPEQQRVGIPAREAIDRAADALAEVVTEPIT